MAQLFGKKMLGSILLLSILVAPTFAWGDKGHRATALLAYSLLTPAAKKDVDAILQGAQFLTLSTWPDDMKKSALPGKDCPLPGGAGCNQNYRPETAQWHFVDMPMNVTDFDPTGKYCESSRYGDCIVPAIEQFREVIARTDGKNISALDPEKKRKLYDALSFLTHLLGDIHQPLHCADNDDGGGNNVLVTWPGEPSYPFGSHIWNLHSVWDTYLVELEIAKMPPAKRTDKGLATDIGSGLTQVEIDFAQLRATELVAGQGETVANWANHSHKLAKDRVYVLPTVQRTTSYSGLSDNNKPIIDLSAGYLPNSAPYVRTQIKLGGIRLARLLNEALKKN